MVSRPIHLVYLLTRAPLLLILAELLYPAVFSVVFDHHPVVYGILAVASSEPFSRTLLNLTMLTDGLMPPSLVVKSAVLGAMLAALWTLLGGSRCRWILLPGCLALLAVAGYPFGSIMLVLTVGAAMDMAVSSHGFGKDTMYLLTDFAPGISELFLTPLYIERLAYLLRVDLRRIKRALRTIHFFVLISAVILLVSPAHLAVEEPIVYLPEEATYGLAVDATSGRVFFSAGHSVYEWSNGSSTLLFRSETIAETIELNERTRELYIIDRSNFSLLAIHIDTRKQAHLGHDNGLNRGDSRSISHGDSLFVVNDEPCYLYRFDIPQHFYQRVSFYSYNAEIIYDNRSDSLFVSEWQPNRQGGFSYLRADPGRCNITPKNESLAYHLIKLDPQDLAELVRVRTPGPNWDMKLLEGKLFAAFPFGFILRSYVYVYDPQTMLVVNTFRVPFGTRAIAIDSRNRLLFAGSMVTNLIEVKDLETRQTLGTIQLAGKGLREMAIDQDRTALYVSSLGGGLFRLDYRRYTAG